MLEKSHEWLRGNSHLIVPELLVEDNSLAPETILKPAFDAIWNAAGLPQSPYYDADGNWTTRRD